MLRFLDLLFPPRQDEAILRDVSDDAFLSHLAPQIISATSPATVALLPFRDPWVRAAVHEAKYHGSDHAFHLLSAALGEYIRDMDDTGHRKIFIVPVPLGEARKKERGFNQIEEVVRRALREIDAQETSGFILETNLLKRTRETVSQVTLPRHEREKNMHDAFAAAFPANPAHTYIVIDDVITTGATLRAAIGALKAAGVVHIIPLALAH